MTQEEAEMLLDSQKQDEEAERGAEERRGFGLPQVLKDW